MYAHPLLIKVAVATVVTLAAHLPARAQDEVFKEPRSSSCVVRITYDSSVIPLTADTVMALLESAGVRDAAIRAVKTEADASALEEAEIGFEQLSPASGSMLVGRVVVEVYDADKDPDVARKILADVCERLREALLEVSRSDREHLMRQRAQAEQALEEATARFDELSQLEASLTSAAGRVSLRREHINDEIHELRASRRELEADFVAQQAREEALASKIAEIGGQIEDSSKSDEVSIELMHVLQLKQEGLERVRALVESDQASEPEMMQALEEVARLRAEIAERREHARQAGGGELLANFNEQLIDLSIESAELRSRIEFVDAQLKEIEEKNIVELSARFEREVEMQRGMLETAIHDATFRVYEINQLLHGLQEPYVIVIGGAK